jgi:(p)ppGpp synthase/HD superfamily hydrolase
MDNVTKAEAIATAAHSGQFDKLGNDYIDHPRRVAAQFDPAAQPEAVCVAWLHDVIEDTAVTADDLDGAGFSEAVISAILLLTRRDDVSDELYYARIRADPLARAVKLADINDNTASWRVEQLDPDVRDRLAAKYAHARDALGAS